MAEVNWLPALVLMTNYGNEWEYYIEAVYSYFKADFVDDKPVFRGTKLGLKRHPLDQGKEITFWHMVSEGSDETNRLPELRRCERIRWPRPIIEHCDDEAEIIKIWENERKGETRILLWFEQQEYLVVLAKRSTYILPWTAYPVVKDHQKRKLRQEYEAYRKANAASS
jgi:hypothetical protein